jgi:hypothetical protein
MLKYPNIIEFNPVPTMGTMKEMDPLGFNGWPKFNELVHWIFLCLYAYMSK